MRLGGEERRKGWNFILSCIDHGLVDLLRSSAFMISKLVLISSISTFILKFSSSIALKIIT